MSLAQAREMQFRYVDTITRHFSGDEILEAGDYGIDPALGRPRSTARVESVLAEFFQADSCALVRGAGTGAIRSSCIAALNHGDAVLVHHAPLYATTAVTFRAMGITNRPVDFNDLEAVAATLTSQPVAAVYIQHSRQLLEDHYDLAELIATCRLAQPGVRILVDDNYTALHVPRIGIQLGADLSTFSLFKLLGPAGIGVVAGNAEIISRIRTDAYSGGSQVQGPEAMDALRSLATSPVLLAVGAEVVDETVRRLNRGEVEGVAAAYISDHQERTVLVELEQPVAKRVVGAANQLGASTRPVGSSSRYEVGVLVYRISRALMEADPTLAARFLRINPFRAGPDTVIRILRRSLEMISANGEQAT
jgi:hypothetical protein